ncbi:ABC transporter substrate-binding protein [Paenibacillus hamazuiensis]|uniref:ABC transporter substrate-binding protein n=1 Tax=Paenibacillus hamazuiensis TaxID=2936508 RepID=UPI00200CCC18|nr:ABC transporter substrate-binding protein [Paenibacillus hamazuiensis]
MGLLQRFILNVFIGFAVLLSGCAAVTQDAGNNYEFKGSAGTRESLAAEPSRTADRTITLGFSQLGTESDWRNANTASIKDAAKEAEIRLIFENAEQSQEQQFQAVRSFIRQKVDVIAIAPVVEKGWEPILREARQAGIPVILVDRLAEVSDTSLYTALIGSDFYEEGRKAGKFVVDKVKNVPGPVGIAELKGTAGSAPSIGRGDGFREIVRNHSDLAILESAVGNFTFEEGKEAMRSILKARGAEVRVLFSHNDDMALGAIEAIEEYGLSPGKDIVIVSVDGTRRALVNLEKGKLNYVVECNPLLGPNLMQAVKELMRGRTLPKRILTPETVFTEATPAAELANRKY